MGNDLYNPLNRQPRVLVLREGRDIRADTIFEHYEALVNSDNLDTYPLTIYGGLPRYLDLAYFDAIVVHYSITVANPRSLDKESRSKIAAFKGLKIVFIQDEFRFINATMEALKDLGINILMSVAPEKELRSIYLMEMVPNIRLVSVLTGYVSDNLKKIRNQPAYSQRSTDIFYRSRTLPFWLGALGQEKVWIAEGFSKSAREFGLHTDISCKEEDRLYGKKWLNALLNSKATLGSESGASVYDFDGSIQAAIKQYLKLNPTADFFEVQRKFLSNHERGGAQSCGVISPRIFEAAACKTLMVLYEGNYSNILEPWKHYVPLKKDHSNMAEVCSVIKDEQQATEIIERAYREIVQSPLCSYKALTRILEEEVIAGLSLETINCAGSLVDGSSVWQHFYVKSLNVLYAPLMLFGWVKSRAYHLVFGVLLKNNPKKDEIKDTFKRFLSRTGEKTY